MLFGELERPRQGTVDRELLERRGEEHEQRVLAFYEAEGRRVVRIGAAVGRDARDAAAQATIDAMRSGADVIYQGVLRHGDWFGRPDFLLRHDDAGAGTFHYEPVDAKLARETKGRAVLQLCVYADLLGAVQGETPATLWIVPGTTNTPVPLRFADYAAYYRRVKARFGEFVGTAEQQSTYPEPVEHCEVCPWWKRCEDRRRDDDHPSLIAGITRRHRERLADVAVSTMAGVAGLPEALSVPGIRAESLGRIRHQARLQVIGRDQQRPVHERLCPEEPSGLVLLPDAAPGDLFLDLEGDSFVADQGLEYLFGLYEPAVVEDYFGPPEVVSPERYRGFWATKRSEERTAFEAVVDHIVERRRKYPNLHVYHFGHRENTALKKLAARHGTRADEVDVFLRESVLVDLHRVTRQGIRASVESYSLKELERFYGFERSTAVRDASAAMHHFCWWLETGEAKDSPDDLRVTIERYNEEDCRSTWALREWLKGQREELRREMGGAFPRTKEPKPSVISEKRAEIRAEVEAIQARLRSDLPDDAESDAPDQKAKRLLSHLLEWHAREKKPEWWEYFDARDVPPDERVEDRTVLGELVYRKTLADNASKSMVTDVYEFPAQEHRIRLNDKPLDPVTERGAGTVVAIGSTEVHLRHMKKKDEAERPRALIPAKPRDTDQQEGSLRRLGAWVAENGLEGPGPFRAARDLLLRRVRRIGGTEGAALAKPGEDGGAAVWRVVPTLDGSVLAVQGPPGSGKTTAAARLIVDLVKSRLRVGVTANSHKVILNLMRKAREEAAQTGLELRCLHRGDEDDYGGDPVDFEISDDYGEIGARLGARELDLVGATSFAWSRADLAGKVDVLVVDEAGQLSLANVLAVSPAAHNLVLFGDPAQLEQPQKGVHPPGSGCSALEHVLGDAPVMPSHLGVFMARTRRLHPEICRFTSAVFYDGQLQAEPSLGVQRVIAGGPLAGSGLRFVPVEHRGNTNHSPEEVDRIAALVEELFAGSPRFVDAEGKEHPMGPDDILIVAPYNVQVDALKERLPAYKHRVGTVDKFQGQEAPVVFYSMTTSSAEDSPRGMEFLFSLNRLNVATSRAKAVVVVVANPELARARCRTPRQMKLANAFCAYLELCERPSLGASR